MIQLHDPIDRPRHQASRRQSAIALAIVLSAAAALAGCSDDDDEPPPVASSPATLACDDTLKDSFKPDADTTVLLVKAYAANEAIALADTPADPAPPTAAVPMCLVKLIVGPGNPGPDDAPSTSSGIGIEVWLPQAADWNERIRAFGSGGWAGGAHSELALIGTRSNFLLAANQGYVISTSDHGHPARPAGRGGSFTMNPDGSINTVLWQDFAERSLHEQAVKTKALVQAYYGRAHQFAYWDGYSTGGRQGYKLAQKYPDDFDGILAGAPAFNWSKFITAELYPQLVMQRQIGSPIAIAKLDALSGAAVGACGGAELGFLIDPRQCRYDPTRDAAALCTGTTGNDGIVGTNDDAAACVNLAEADAVNRIWYGQHFHGQAPDPAVDNGSADAPASNHLWFGLSRGTRLNLLAGATPFPIATDMVAIELQNPTLAQANFTNPTGNGTDGWKNLSYEDLANAYLRGIDLQSSFADINTDNPDLTSARDVGTRILSYHGWADDLIMPNGSINYYTRVAAQMGGDDAVQQFNRLYMIPALAHDGSFARSASVDPATGAPTDVAKVPLPQGVTGRDELFNALRNWVENGQAPDRIDLSSPDNSVTMPICVYPKIARHDGSGPMTAAASYRCE